MNSQDNYSDLALNAEGRRLLIICPDVPHPEQGASTVLFYYYIAALKKAGFKILNLLLIEANEANSEKIVAYKAQMQVSEQFEVLPCLSEKFVQSGRFNHKFNAQALQQVVGKIDAFQAEITICLDLSSAWASKYLSTGRKIVWLGDLNYDSYWYNSLYAWKEGLSKPWHLVWAVAQRWSWKRIYSKVLGDMDNVIVSSHSSVRSLANFGIRSRYLPYPWPNKFEAPRNTAALPKKPTFLLFGTLAALGSRSALHFLVDKIYPRLSEAFGKDNFCIQICGQKTLPNWATESIQDKPEITFLGFVDDLGALMEVCHAMIAPIDVPVGNRSRILTALGARLPVVAHKNTALGNPGLVHGETCLLASAPDGFVECMCRIVEKPKEAQVIADAGHVFYEANFAPAAATSIFLQEVIE